MPRAAGSTRSASTRPPPSWPTTRSTCTGCARRGGCGRSGRRRGSSPPTAPAELLTSGSKAQALRELELAMIGQRSRRWWSARPSATQVEHDAPGTETLLVPTIHEIEQYVFGPDERSGVLFVGGFEHPPNIDAAIRLVREVMPAVWRQRPTSRSRSSVPNRAPRGAGARLSERWKSPAGSRTSDPLFDRRECSSRPCPTARD